MSYRGINWGKVDFSESAMKFTTADDNPKPIFGIEYQSINNATINKNDIIIETGGEIQNDQDCMCQIRLHVETPKEENENEKDDGADRKINEGEEEANTEKERVNHAQETYKKILEKAKIGSFGGESLVTLNEVNLAVPRGKYTIDFYQKSLRFHGQTYNFIIEYKNILKGFLLPMENESQISIVLKLSPERPVYQGQTVYRNIMIQVKKQLMIETKTRLKDKEKCPQMKDEYSGPLFQVFMDILRATSQLTLISPDLKDFKSKGGQSCVKCGVKAQTGWVYFLKKSLIFIPKPVLYFKIEEIKNVEFSRLGANNKQFDMQITLKTDKKAMEFIGIERNELDGILEYLKFRSVHIEMEKSENKMKADQDEDEDDEEDDDFNAEEDESEESEDSESEEPESFSEQKSKKSKKHKKKEKKEDD